MKRVLTPLASQKTRKKKAAIALARKLAVIAWAMLRDEEDWEPGKMIEVTESYGGKLPLDKEAFQAMAKKESRHKRFEPIKWLEPCMDN